MNLTANEVILLQTIRDRQRLMAQADVRLDDLLEDRHPTTDQQDEFASLKRQRDLDQRLNDLDTATLLSALLKRLPE